MESLINDLRNNLFRTGMKRKRIGDHNPNGGMACMSQLKGLRLKTKRRKKAGQSWDVEDLLGRIVGSQKGLAIFVELDQEGCQG